MDGALKPAVLLTAYGAADSLEELPAYLKDILGGREVPERLLADIRERYRAIGGRSPLKRITEAQRAALAERLGGRASVFAGMHHSAPTIRAAVERIRAAGHREILCAPLTPYRCALSVGAYLRAAREAADAAGGGLAVREVSGWSDDPALVAAFADTIRRAREELPEPLRAAAALLLTAHSLPERIRAEGDPYPAEFEAAARTVAAAAGFPAWRFAYQSKGGGAQPSSSRAVPRGTAGPPREEAREPWLGPDAAAVIAELAASGRRALVLAPIGFIAEHLETLYDDDILYRGLAEAKGLRFARAAALNDHPGLIGALSAAVERALAAA